MVRVQAVESKAPSMTTAEFVRKWGPGGTADGLNERSGAQPHFIDLCALLGVAPPADPENYCFERGLWGVSGGRRFADVWMRGHFGWEYKAPGGDLTKALEQLMQYALPLENPPLLIVSDRHSIQIHTHFTGHPSVRVDIKHDELRDPRKQALLRSAFLSPRDFRPIKTSGQLTEELAGSFARIADALRARGETPFRAAHFLTQCIFCCFAESIGVLPEQVFRRVVQKRQAPAGLQRNLTRLFEMMSEGGEFGADSIPWFNGGLFKQVDVPVLEHEEIALLGEVAGMSWASIDPSILGTLFERGLDPKKRHQMGAHYTDAATIDRLVDPVIRQPLMAEWDAIRRQIAGALSKRDVLAVRAKGIPSKSPALKARHSGIRSQASRANRQANDLQSGFMERLQSFRVLDPACGSGNFLFLALKALKDIEHQVNMDSEELGLERQISVTGPHNVLGIEINEYAAELARATVWIGELQWRKEHGYGWKENPILDPLDQIECRDAVLNERREEAAWPPADVVVSNPPFLGDKKMRGELGADYVAALRIAYRSRVPGAADLVCYWFEKARAQLAMGGLKRVGLVATNSIRGGKNRAVMDQIFSTTRIFNAWSDEDWVNNGAAVRVSLVAFGDSPMEPCLNGSPVAGVGPNLASLGAARMSTAVSLVENAGVAFQGPTKGGRFDVDGAMARQWLSEPTLERSNDAVLFPWWNGDAVTGRWSDKWIIDFDERPLSEAALYESPFEWVRREVKPQRSNNAEKGTRERFWLFKRSGAEQKSAVKMLHRSIATPEVSKHRVFVWLPQGVAADKNLVVIARADDATWGVLQGRFHEVWALATGTSLEDRPRYTSTTTFRSFPFPAGLTPSDTAHQRTQALGDGTLIPADLPTPVRRRATAIATAARRLNALRDRWLNPPAWCERLPEAIPLGLSRSSYPDRVAPRPGFEGELAKRTLTNLYNQRPTWLAEAHQELDLAVASAYGWSDYTSAMADEEILRRLLALNLERAAVQPGKQAELPLLGLVHNQAKAEETKTSRPGGKRGGAARAA